MNGRRLAEGRDDLAGVPARIVIFRPPLRPAERAAKQRPATGVVIRLDDRRVLSRRPGRSWNAKWVWSLFTRLVVIAAAAVFVMSARAPATAASPELCRQFHRECTEARAAGYRDVGICHIERLECPTDEDARVPNASHETRGEDRHDPEASWGERSIGP